MLCRHYLDRDFPDIAAAVQQFGPSRHVRFLECGCGVGNALFPLVGKYPCLDVVAVDLSARAIALVKVVRPVTLSRHIMDIGPCAHSDNRMCTREPDYLPFVSFSSTLSGCMCSAGYVHSACLSVLCCQSHPLYNTGQVSAHVCDAVCEPLAGIAPSMDLALMLFMASALSPHQLNAAFRNVADTLAPGGVVCARVCLSLSPCW